MATILTKKKDTSGAPSAGDLTNSTGGAELAVNTADKRLYTKDSGGNVVEIGTNPTSITTGTLNTSGAVVFNDAGADVDFRVEGDTDANLLFVDASTDRVGIGTSTPDALLNVDGIASFGAGSASTPSIAAAGDLNTGIFFPAADTIAFAEGGAEAMRVDSSGRLVIDASISRNDNNNSIFGNSNGYLYVEGGTNGLIVANNSGADCRIRIEDDNTIQFQTASTERMRITSGGFFKASVDGTYINAGALHELKSNAATAAVAVTNSSATTPSVIFAYLSGATPDNTSDYFLRCDDTTNTKAVIYSNGDFQSRTNSYGGISDVKLKQDIVDANSQWDDIKGLRIRKYRFKDEVAADPNYPSHLGVIAQEAEIVSPGLVFESPDFESVEVPVLDDEGNPVLDEDGNPQVTTERQATGTVTKGVKYSILYMKAVKALQEAMERIETLEASNTALEARIAALENA